MSTVELATKLSDLQLTMVYLDQVILRKREEVALEQGTTVKWKLVQHVSFLQSALQELRIKLQGRVEFEEESPKPFDLELSLVGVYKSREPIEASRVPDYVMTHSVPLLWPYVREAISDLTTRMGGPTFILPTLYIQVSDRKAENAESAPTTSPEIISSTTEETVEEHAVPASKKSRRRGKAE